MSLTNIICNICAETVTQKLVECGGCKMEACVSCWQKFLLTRSTMCCMNTNCTHEWTYKSLSSNFNKSFVIGPLRKHRETIFYDMEKALLPEAVESAEMIKKLKNDLETADEVNRSIHRRMNNCIQRLFTSIPIMMTTEINPIYYRKHFRKNKQDMIRFLKNSPGVTISDMAALNEHFTEAELICNEELQIIDYIRARISRVYKSAPTKVERRAFIKNCPGTDCRGFLSTQWKCGLCNTKVCSKCHAVKDDGEHTCNPDELATAEFLMKDTKPCPTCATAIHKIMGCDQMFCIVCHTAFDYKTNRIVHGNIHNPHYFEWLRTQNRPERNPLDIPCGRELSHHIISGVSRTVRILLNLGESENMYDIIFMNILYLKEFAERRYRVDIMDNREFRIMYLMGEITEADLKRKTFIRYRHNEINRELRYSFLLFRDVATELIFNLIEILKSPRGIPQNPLIRTQDSLKKTSIENFKIELKAIQDMVLVDLENTCSLFKISKRSFDVFVTNNEWLKNIKPI